jgi:hypothetical protein
MMYVSCGWVEPPAALAVLGIGSVPSPYLIDTGTGKDFYKMEEEVFWKIQELSSAYENRRRKIIDSAVEKLSGPPSPEQDEEVRIELEQAQAEYKRELRSLIEAHEMELVEMLELEDKKPIHL